MPYNKDDYYDDISLKSEEDTDEDEEEFNYIQCLVEDVIDEIKQKHEPIDENDSGVEDNTIDKKLVYKVVIKRAKEAYDLSTKLEDDAFWIDITEKANRIRKKMKNYNGSDITVFEMALKYFKPHIMEMIQDKLEEDEEGSNNDQSDENEQEQIDQFGGAYHHILGRNKLDYIQ